MGCTCLLAGLNSTKSFAASCVLMPRMCICHYYYPVIDADLKCMDIHLCMFSSCSFDSQLINRHVSRISDLTRKRVKILVETVVKTLRQLTSI